MCAFRVIGVPTYPNSSQIAASSGSSGLAQEPVGDYVHHRSCQSTSRRLLVRTVRVATTPGVSSQNRLRSTTRSSSTSGGSGRSVVRNRTLTACEAQRTGLSSPTSYVLPGINARLTRARLAHFCKLSSDFDLQPGAVPSFPRPLLIFVLLSRLQPGAVLSVCLVQNPLSFTMQFKHLLALLPFVLMVAAHPARFRREDESSAIDLPAAPLQGDSPALPGQPLDETFVFGEDGELNTFVAREPQNLPTGQTGGMHCPVFLHRVSGLIGGWMFLPFPVPSGECIVLTLATAFH
ncbi:hypothetical protein C8Q78DRAFT_264143 [Trametes maxima]|nr:hypothetical protein C8Q78DRAFT_264143 [Trametes maxima]